jgi:predicted site-specific integrase-resolvase
MAALPKMIPLADAADRLKLSQKHLHRLINNGKINAATINGETVVREYDVIKLTPTPRDSLVEYRKFKSLKGIPIWLSEAARKYDINHITILQWTRKGYIAKLGTDGNKLLLNEQDVAYCKLIYDRVSGENRKGRRIFNDDGTPFTPRPPRRKPQAATAN